ncbi:MAG: NADH:flavin oxidoreductase, Old Yellow Enzyme family [Mucilaginibacter sp.]|nr:NADH:flavin oxidoreductase, Old Yellow Enzyme family [Mucilaginibacter sp.]
MESQVIIEEHAEGSGLFSPIAVGPLNLSHRVVLAPLTRMRTVSGSVPNDLMVKYYAQRSTPGGFLIAEATQVSPKGNGYFNSPGIFTDEQEAGWKTVVEAVHAKGSLIFLQLYHAGRVSHSSLQPDHGLPLGPSVVPHQNVAGTPNGWEPTTLNRALETDEIKEIVKEFGRATARAREAGFDGVELHGANGYLVDQFLQDGSNKRTDSYGGSIENRSRFLLEVVEEMVNNWSGDRVAIRVGPSGRFNDMSDSDPLALFSYVTGQLNQFGLAYLHVIEPRVVGSYMEKEGVEPVASMHLRKIFKGRIIAAGGFDRDGAIEIIKNGHADLVAFGRHFIANPDLPYRYRHGLPLNPYNRETFYGGNETGYLDYPFYETT